MSNERERNENSDSADATSSGHPERTGESDFAEHSEAKGQSRSTTESHTVAPPDSTDPTDFNEHSHFTPPEGNLSFRVGRLQIDVENRWDAASILNDVMTGLWFVAGSVLNFFDSLQTLALVLYLAGSLQLLARAFFRLERRIHIGGGYRRSKLRMYRPDIDR